jgi:hypothetical protein
MNEPLTRVEQRLLDELLTFHAAHQPQAASSQPLAADLPRFGQPLRRSHLIQNLVVLGMILIVGGVLLVRAAGLGGGSAAAAIKPLHYTPPGPGAPSGSQLLRALADIAAHQPAAPTPTPHGRYAYVKTSGWYTIGGQGPGVGSTFPQSTQSWTLPDGAGRSLTVTGTGSHRRVDDLHVRKGPPVFDLSTNPRLLTHQLAVGHPRSGVPAEQLVDFEDLDHRQPIPPAADAAILKLLAQIPHLTNHGTVTDRAGRHGIAVSLDTSEFGGGIRETLVFDPHTGQLLSYEETLIRQPKGSPDQFPIGAVLSYTDILRAGYVNNATSTPQRAQP